MSIKKIIAVFTTIITAFTSSAISFNNSNLTEFTADAYTFSEIYGRKFSAADGNTSAGQFVWGKDNWSFSNTSDYFTRGTYYMNQKYIDKLSSYFDEKKMNIVRSTLGTEWKGAGHGLCVLSLLAKSGYFPYNEYTSGAACLNEIASPADNDDIESLINYYHFTQLDDDIQAIYRTTPNNTQKENIENIINMLQASPEVIIGYQMDGWGSKTVLAYGITYGNWKFNNREYQGRIEIYDPKDSKEYDPDICIYFNSSSYDWIIPEYISSDVSSYNGAVFNFIENDLKLLNKNGYISIQENDPQPTEPPVTTTVSSTNHTTIPATSLTTTTTATTITTTTTKKTTTTTKKTTATTKRTTATTKRTTATTKRTTATTKRTTTTTKRTTATTKKTTATTKKTTVTTQKTTPTTNSLKLTWKKDNWSFNNSRQYFSSYGMNKEYLNKLRNNMTNTEWNNACTYILNTPWEGSCYGMSALAALSKNKGIVPFSSYTKGAKSLYDLSSPNYNSNVKSLVNYYMCLQMKSSVQQVVLKTFEDTHEKNIKNIISQLNESPTVLVDYQQPGWGGHSVVAYGVTYGTWTKKGVKYTGRIEISDPNFFGYYEDACIYFDKNNFNWAIPEYDIKTGGKNGAKITLVCNDSSVINSGGYLSGTAHKNTADYCSKMEIAAAGDTYNVHKVIKDDDVFINQATGEGEIEPETFYNLFGESEGRPGYILKDSNAGYKFYQEENSEIDLSIDYENCMLKARASSGSEIIFDPSGYTDIEGTASDYNIDMVFNENYPTDWYKINVSGYDSENISLQKSENGYILKGNNLKDVTVKANNHDSFARCRFSTEYDNVYIYEINEKTIGVSVDTDNNGSYETAVETFVIDILHGDISGNDKIDLYDAIEIAKSLVGERCFIDEENEIADFNKDGKVDLYDAIGIAKYLLGSK